MLFYIDERQRTENLGGVFGLDSHTGHTDVDRSRSPTPLSDNIENSNETLGKIQNNVFSLTFSKHLRIFLQRCIRPGICGKYFLSFPQKNL